MKKSTISIIIGVAIAIVLGITAVGMLSDELIIKNILTDVPSNVEIPGLGHPDALTSGPLTITKYEYKITENIFMIISGLEKNDKGNIRIFMPDGRLYKTIEYDGLQKESFNQYFKPDTSATRKICEQEELVGRWAVVFDNNAYPPLVFEIINEHLEGPDIRLPKSC